LTNPTNKDLLTTALGYNAELIIFSSALDVVDLLLATPAPIRVVAGSYKSVKEVSYITQISFYEKLLVSGLLATQESVLLLSNPQQDGSRIAYLQYMYDNRMECIGKFAPADSINTDEDFTYDPYMRQFFTVTPLKGTYPKQLTEEEVVTA